MSPVTVRPYRPSDHAAGRRLWTELTRQHREMYSDAVPHSGYVDEDGASFEEYLARLDLSGMWVAEDAEDGVVGLVGLIMRGRVGEVEPVVVSAPHRGHGTGRRLLEHVADEARRRGLSSLTISPASRNVEAIRCLHAAGYDVLSSVELTLDLGGRGRQWRGGLELHELRFRS